MLSAFHFHLPFPEHPTARALALIVIGAVFVGFFETPA